MRSEDRQKIILSRAQEAGFVSIPQTAEEFGMSVETVRRDINKLCQQNLLKKSHGGAVPIKAPIFLDQNYFTRINRNQQGKMAICREAAKLVRDGTVISFDGGATTAMLASCIENVRGVTFVVNSLPIATTLVDKVNAKVIAGTVIMTGGQINSPGYRTYFPMALETIDKYYFNTVFLSCTALSAAGASNSATNTSIYVEHLMRRASTSVLLVDSDKLGKNSVCQFAKLTEFDRIITDDKNPCPPDILKVLENSDTELTIVHCEE